MPPALALHYARLYGTRAERVVDGARKVADLGKAFGGRLYQREAEFLIAEEWAATDEDILTRRTKHYLHLTPQQTSDFQSWMAAR